MELHRKTLNVDQFFDARLETTTLRSAWSEVRDNVEREAQTRRAFIDSMTHEVVGPLISFKVGFLFQSMPLSGNPDRYHLGDPRSDSQADPKPHEGVDPSSQ